MKQISHWLKFMATLTVAAIATANPLTTTRVFATSVANLTPEADAIEISVPPPQTLIPPPPIQPIGEPNFIEIYVPPPEPGNNGICPAFLDMVIDSIVDRPAFARGKWGILVESLTDSTVFYSHNDSQYLIPASNIKLLTTAAALERLDARSPIGSKSIGEWVRITNLNSNNSYANSLLSHIGGAKTVQDALTRIGVDPNGYRQVDGSGLSRQNLATARSLVATLKGMKSSKGREIFYASLPISGTSGTLRNRLRGTSTVGRIHAKTGTLRGVRALSGYLEHPEYGTLVFSIMANDPSQSGYALVGAIDEIVLRLSQLTRCQ